MGLRVMRGRACVLALLLAAVAGCAQDPTASQVEALGQADFGDGPGILVGQVVDPEIVPVEGAQVFVLGTQLRATTDATGLFRIGPLEPGLHSLRVERQGYATADAEVSLGTPVTIILDPVASDVPYHETTVHQAYLMCHVVFILPGGEFGGLNAPCAAIIDLVAKNTAPDDWIFPFTVENPGFESLVMEMTWMTQQFGHDGLLQLTTFAEAEVGSGVTIGGTVYGGTMGPPFHVILHAGQSYWEDDDEPVYFYPEPNATQKFELLVAGGEGNTTIPGGAVFLEFRPTVYLSFFYNREATEGFTALPDE